MAVPHSVKPGWISPEEYEQREREAEYKSEWYDGVIIPRWSEDPANFAGDSLSGMAGGSPAHTTLSARLALSVRLNGASANCSVFTSEVRIVPSVEQEKRGTMGPYVYPDFAVVCNPLWSEEHTGAILNPLIVFEILSPSSELRDRTKKFDFYAAIPSVEAIVLVASERRRVEVYTRQSPTAWLLESYDRGVADLPQETSLDLRVLYESVPGLD